MQDSDLDSSSATDRTNVGPGEAGTGYASSTCSFSGIGRIRVLLPRPQGTSAARAPTWKSERAGLFDRAAAPSSATTGPPPIAWIPSDAERSTPTTALERERTRFACRSSAKSEAMKFSARSSPSPRSAGPRLCLDAMDISSSILKKNHKCSLCGLYRENTPWR